MKIKILVDNISNDSFFKKEWGLSILVKYYSKNILLDFGQSNKFIKNTRPLDINIADVDYAVLSHAHYDHSDGMKYFFKENNKATLYLRDESRNKCYSTYKFCGIKYNKYVGIHHGYLTKFQDRLTYLNGDNKEELSKNVYLVPHNTNSIADEAYLTPGMHIRKFNEEENKYEKTLEKDLFNHEMSLVIDTKDGLVIFNSCSHFGVKNIIEEVKKEFNGKKVYAYIGGLHLFSASDSKIKEVGEYLKSEDVEYIIIGHCTGDIAYEVLYPILGERLTQMESGLEIEI